ncbi:hypothetical protein INT47_011738 [Mucor saturninus]|uniref:polynucleotide adenylyltransferase n=1 Tax=Mucor saturninus TaxID=64648 RepID=A0A8H7R377_9FUNG|nr:hypothetical protein INT47_011738 [Mucor saturninus]
MQESFSDMSLYEDEEDYSPSSSAFESCSSDLTDASTVVSVSSCLKEDQAEDYLIFPPIILPFHDSLSFNILSLYRKLIPSRQSFNKRQVMMIKIEKMLNREWPAQRIKVHLFGSSQNNLGTDQSDVDICISTAWNGLRCIKTLANVLRKNGLQIVRTIPRAKVPIVKIWDPVLQLACDLNVNNTISLQNTRMIKTYVAIDPRVRPLILIIKHWTKQRKLNDAASGGTLSTYTWTCMIIHFLQTRNPPILPKLHEIPHALSGDNVEINGQNSSFCDDLSRLVGFGTSNYESLGGLLYAFFRKFAYEFDYQTQVISVRSGRLLTKIEKGWHKGIESKRLLCIEEPFDTRRNLGNSADAASVIGLQLEFQRAVHILLETRGNLEVLCHKYHSFQV